MGKEPTGPNKRLRALTNELIAAYSEFVNESEAGTLTWADFKVRKKALAGKEKEMERLFRKAEKAASPKS